MERVVFIWRILNETGFSLLQTMVAYSIVMIITLSIVPGIYTLKKENKLLDFKISIINSLHDHLIEELTNDYLVIMKKEIVIDKVPVEIKYKDEANFLRVCAEWTSIKNVNETRCLYGKRI